MDDREIIDEFVVESREHLADIESQLLAIEAGGEAIDVELVNTVFRAIHSIKGAAGFFQFSSVERLAHEMENVLNLIRNRQLVPNPSITDALLRAADTLRTMIENIERSNEVEVSHHLAELRAVAAGEPASEPAPVSAAVEPPHPLAAATSVDQTLDLVQTFVSQAASESPGGAPAACDPPSPNVASVLHHGGPIAERAAAHDPRNTKSLTPAPVAETNIRVSVCILDHLMNLAGELVLARNQLLQTVTVNDRGSLDSVSARLNQVTSEIQEAVMQTRLQTVNTVFSKFPRVVRDLSNLLGKQCELVVEGEDVELDKSIIEAIGDPLTHLIRNAVDHGLENPEARIKAGKPPKGKVLLKAFHEAGKVNLAVSDDGAGIDVVKLKEKAVARGIITAEQARDMGDREALHLIFRPGFSTAEQVTNVSGRGVGMDVVKTNIERLGGTVDVDAQLGAGTTIGITLPLTLAIIPSLIVRCGARRFAIPQASINELVRVKVCEAEEKLHRVKDAEVLRLRGNLLPLVRLSATLGLDPPEQKPGVREADGARNINIIVVDSGHLRYGLVVDSLHDSEEIVVKPLGQHLKNCRCFAGATILGDGQVALILDVVGIATQANLTVREEKDRLESRESAADSAQHTQSMLLFTNGAKEQFAVPMGLVSRLERIRSDQIDSVGGQDVLQYRGASLALLSLEKYIKAVPRSQESRLYVVVFTVAQREVGLIAPRLTDIRRVSTDVDTTTFREPGVIGSLVIDGTTTRLLDLLELSRTARPDWFSDVPVADGKRGDALTILLAEDSAFFRKQLTSSLQAGGYNVVACEDGQAAWDSLISARKPYDLIVTDLEMPRLDGFELAEKVRSTPAFHHLPIIAVTSLASEEDMDRGKQVGIDDYHIKLDRERLMATVAKLLGSATQDTGIRASQTWQK